MGDLLGHKAASAATEAALAAIGSTIVQPYTGKPVRLACPIHV